MRNHWRPDATFFGKRTRGQLVANAIDCGYAEVNGQVSSYKKVDLLNCLIRHFQTAKSAAPPTLSQQKAREWLPEAILFPAVDPDAPAEAEHEPGPDDEVSGEE
jgi:ParB family chromosome partitioning protein